MKKSKYKYVFPTVEKMSGEEAKHIIDEMLYIFHVRGDQYVNDDFITLTVDPDLPWDNDAVGRVYERLHIRGLRPTEERVLK